MANKAKKKAVTCVPKKMIETFQRALWSSWQDIGDDVMKTLRKGTVLKGTDIADIASDYVSIHSGLTKEELKIFNTLSPEDWALVRKDCFSSERA